VSAAVKLTITGQERALELLQAPARIAAKVRRAAPEAMVEGAQVLVEGAQALMRSRVNSRSGASERSIAVKRTEETDDSVSVRWGGDDVVGFLDRGTGAHRDGAVQTDPNAHAKGGIRPRGILADAVKDNRAEAQRTSARLLGDALAQANREELGS